MIDRVPETTIRHPLGRHHRRHGRAVLLRHALRGAAWCAAWITGAVLAGMLVSHGVGAAWARLLLLLGVCGGAILMAAAHVRREGLTLAAFLERAEGRFPPLRSWIRNALDFETRPADHVSPELAGAVRAEAARRLGDVRLEELLPRVEPRPPALAMAAAIAVILGLGAVWPARVQRSWATLWSPTAAAPPVRLVVEPGSVTISPGATVAVRARVWGTDRAPSLLRDPGTAVSATAEGRAEGGGRLWRFDLVQLTRASDYWVRVGGVHSPRYRIALSGSLAPVSFEIEYRAPAYARLPVQRGAAARGDLAALRGTRATLTVTFDRDLERLEARLPDGPSRPWRALSPRRWAGVVPVLRDGEYELVAAASRDRERGETTAPAGRFRYRVSALADAPPILVVEAPQGDVDLPAGQEIPLAVLAQDDLGLSELTLQHRKDPGQPWTDLPLAGFPTRPREARVAARWDASPLGLLPGESATFRFVLFDDNAVSGRGRAVSPVFELRFPSLADLYERVDERQAGAQKALERVTEQARDLQRSLDKLARQQPRPESESAATFERSEELRTALKRQQEVGRQIAEAAEDLKRSVEQAAERQAFGEELMRKLRQMAELLDQIQSREFRETLRKMQEALEQMDRQALERRIPEWRAENQELLRNLERTIELLKKLREEERLQSLAQRARELEAKQEALNREHERSSSPRSGSEDASLADRQERAAWESEALGEEIGEAAANNQNEERSAELSQAAQETRQEAASSQRDAAQSAARGNRRAAGAAGQRARDALARAGRRLQEAAEATQEEQDQLDLAAVRRAAQDLVSLQRATDGNLDSTLPPRAKADRQIDLSEGTARVADSLFQLSRQTPFLSPRLTEALGRAINHLQSSGRDLANGLRARGEESGRTATRSLNEAVLELRAAESAMCNLPGEGAGGKINPRRIGDIGRRQSELNRETRSVAERLSQQMRLSGGDRAQLERLAEEQERIRRQLEEVRRDEDSRRELLGRLDRAEREMKDVEEILRGGPVDGSLEEKQQRILSRLLDAQRSVNRRDFDPQRESRPGEDVSRASPAEIPAELARRTDRFRQDLLRSELDRYPAQYRAFVEAYLRSLNESPR